MYVATEVMTKGKQDKIQRHPQRTFRLGMYLLTHQSVLHNLPTRLLTTEHV